jgi:xanthine dehydrogenase accessory protein XdhC
LTGLSEPLRRWLAAGDPTVLVTVTRALGSAPREAGARMLVTADRAIGTIGGGRLEFEAILAARRMIEDGASGQDMDVPLGPAIGQCCGGHVTLSLIRADGAVLAGLVRLESEERDAWTKIHLFGAGHVGKAIAAALAPLPVRLTWIDSRIEEFPEILPDGVERLVAADPVARVRDAPAGGAFIVLTHSHALDFDLAAAVLDRDDFVYAGMIGSATKRRRFERWYVARGGDFDHLRRLVCPIGAGLGGDKRPAVIAAMVAAELLMATDAGAARVPRPRDHRGQVQAAGGTRKRA